MRLSHLKKRMRSLCKWGALAVGCGGLFAADASAERPDFKSVGPGVGSRQQRDVRLDAVAMQLKGGMIYISERGGAFRRLSLQDAQQGDYLRSLLEQAGAAERPVSVPVGSMIVANGGGAGDATKPTTPDKDTSSAKKPPAKKAKQPPASNSGNGK
jgi:hypothetical protein